MCQRETLTCDLVSTLLTHEPVLQFQKRMWRSAVPPPLASRLGCQGHHARALTAAWCWEKVNSGWVSEYDSPACSCHTCSRLSLPPDARSRPSGDHRRPHTSCEWPCTLATRCSACRTSWWWISPLREPLEREVN